MKGTILLSGGSGTLGRQIYRHFRQHQYRVLVLSRNEKLASRADFIYWDPAKREIDLPEEIAATAVINLAGAGIVEKRWSPAYKKELLDSRVQPLHYLDELMHSGRIRTDHLVSVAASGIYGDRKEKWCHEKDAIVVNSFITQLCQQWEQAVHDLQSVSKKTILRMGIVLSNEGGIMHQYMPLTKLHMAPAFNRGRPYMSWVDVRDMAAVFYFAVEQQLEGIYNVCADHPVNSREFARKFLDTYTSWGFVRKIPNFMLELIMGERSEMLKFSQRMSNELLRREGFEFAYKKLEESLKSLKEAESN